MLEKLNQYTKTVSDLSDEPLLNPAELKAWFDAAPEEMRTYFNKLIDALKIATDGDSGADNIGATPITDITGSTVQSILESLKKYSDLKFIAGQTESSRMEICAGIFFTNGNSTNSTDHIDFTKPFSTPPVIMPANMNQIQPYGDVIRYPSIYNVTTTGFDVKISTGDSNKLGTVGKAANIFMYFVAFGK